MCKFTCTTDDFPHEEKLFTVEGDLSKCDPGMRTLSETTEITSHTYLNQKYIVWTWRCTRCIYQWLNQHGNMSPVFIDARIRCDVIVVYVNKYKIYLYCKKTCTMCLRANIDSKSRINFCFEFETVPCICRSCTYLSFWVKIWRDWVCSPRQ